MTKVTIYSIRLVSYANTVDKYYMYGERLKRQTNDQNTTEQNAIFKALFQLDH